MSKGIIVLDEIPEKCNQCNFWFAKATVPVEYRCMGLQREITENELTKKKPDWCPIKEVGSSAYLGLFKTKEAQTKTIKMVREIVGWAGTMDCKKALERNDWDITRAIEYLISLPLSPAIKRG